MTRKPEIKQAIMKMAVYFLISLLLTICNSLYGRQQNYTDDVSPGDTLRVLSAPDLYDLSVRLAEEYNLKSAGAFIKVTGIPDQAEAGDLIRKGGLGFFPGDFFPVRSNESLLKVVVGRDIIVAVVNAKNPFIEEISRKGIPGSRLAGFVSNEASRNWGWLLNGGSREKAGFYCINDGHALRNLADFLKTDQSLIPEKCLTGGENVLSAVQKDPCAIGFCKLVNLISLQDQGLAGNIRLLPVDRNENGLIDYNEKIYDNINDFTRGVWIGKYPRSLYSNIYSVSSDQSGNSKAAAFLKWVLSDGQKFMQGYGYSDLLASERQSEADKLYTAKISGAAIAGDKSMFRAFLIVIAIVILSGILVTFAMSRRNKAGNTTIPAVQTVLDENSLKLPGGLYFDKTHTWAFLEQDGTVKVGVDDFLQHITGKITRIKMKEPGKKVQKGEQILSIVRNGKQLNLYSPVSGTILENNISLETAPFAVNSSPYNTGWIYKIEPSNWSRESQLLFMADKHREFIKKEFTRLKDFLMNALEPDSGQYSSIILQDGGEIKDGVLSEMGPELWEDFQTDFIDPSRQLWFYEIF